MRCYESLWVIMNCHEPTQIDMSRHELPQAFMNHSELAWIVMSCPEIVMSSHELLWIIKTCQKHTWIVMTHYKLSWAEFSISLSTRSKEELILASPLSADVSCSQSPSFGISQLSGLTGIIVPLNCHLQASVAVSWSQLLLSNFWQTTINRRYQKKKIRPLTKTSQDVINC